MFGSIVAAASRLVGGRRAAATSGELPGESLGIRVVSTPGSPNPADNNDLSVSDAAERPTTRSSWKPVAGGTFSSYSNANAKMKQYAKSSGFSVQKTNHFFEEAKSYELFQVSQRVESRGKWICAVKNCPFHVAYTYYQSERKYHYKEDKFCLDHNHSIQNTTLEYKGITLVNKEDDITKKEMEVIEDVAPAGMGMQKLKDYLETHFPDRKFTSALLHRVKKKALAHRYGEDQHQLNDLMHNGFKMKNEGGAFDFKLDDSARLKSIHWQSPTMKKYAETYGCFVIVDGTHGTNIYGLQLLVYFVVDCFGKTCFAGYSATRSENTDDVDDGMDEFFDNDFDDDDGMEELGLKTQKPSLMSDEGPAFAAVAIKNGLPHKLCGHHYTKNSNKYIAGLGDLHDEFIKDVYSSVYDDMPKEKLDSLLDKAKNTYSGFQKPLEYFTKLSNDKEKVCYSYDSKNHHPYWLIKNHPLYCEALARRNISPDSPPEGASVRLDGAAPEPESQGRSVTRADAVRAAVSSKVYDSISYNDNKEFRVATLCVEFEKLVSKAASGMHNYKLTMASLAELENMLDGAPKDAALPVRAPPPAARGRGRPANPVNNSILAVTSSKKRGTKRRASGSSSGGTAKQKRHRCLTCLAFGTLEYGHRTGKKCPYYGMPLPAQSKQRTGGVGSTDGAGNRAGGNQPLTQLEKEPAQLDQAAGHNESNSRSSDSDSDGADDDSTLLSALAGKCGECSQIGGSKCERCRSALVCRLCCSNRGVPENLIGCASCFSKHSTAPAHSSKTN